MPAHLGARTPESIATALTARLLLFCLATATDWQAASISRATPVFAVMHSTQLS